MAGPGIITDVADALKNNEYVLHYNCSHLLAYMGIDNPYKDIRETDC